MGKDLLKHKLKCKMQTIIYTAWKAFPWIIYTHWKALICTLLGIFCFHHVYTISPQSLPNKQNMAIVP